MGFVFAAPYTPPSPSSFNRWRGSRHTLTGWDGSVWDITDPSRGVALTSDGVEGLGMPDMIQYTHDSPVVNGFQWEGYLITGRKVFLPILVYAGSRNDTNAGAAAWHARNKAFWKIMRPGKTVLWTVEHLSTGVKRTLRLRYADGGKEAMDRDPAQRGWQAYGIEFITEQPLWEGEPVIQTWDVGETLAFLGPTGLGPPVFISPSSTIATATVTNPGDLESFVKWTVIGPATTSQVGVNGGITRAEFAVPGGSKLVLNTDPRDFEATLDGENVMPQMGSFEYEPVPAGEDVDLSLELDGTGSILAEFPTLYLRGDS